MQHDNKFDAEARPLHQIQAMLSLVKKFVLPHSHLVYPILPCWGTVFHSPGGGSMIGSLREAINLKNVAQI